jgi:hypothetical protein
MTYLVPQLDGSEHAGDNCGPASLASLARWATEHEYAPTPTEVRRMMRDFVNGTQMSEHKVAWERMQPKMDALGWTVPNLLYRGVTQFDRMEIALVKGNAVTVAINYGKLDYSSGLKCSRTFNGLHSVAITKTRLRKGKREFKVIDPLADGRRPEVPRGPLWYPRETLREVAGYATPSGPGFAMFNVARKGVMNRNGIVAGEDDEPSFGIIG